MGALGSGGSDERRSGRNVRSSTYKDQYAKYHDTARYRSAASSRSRTSSSAASTDKRAKAARTPSNTATSYRYVRKGNKEYRIAPDGKIQYRYLEPQSQTKTQKRSQTATRTASRATGTTSYSADTRSRSKGVSRKETSIPARGAHSSDYSRYSNKSGYRSKSRKRSGGKRILQIGAVVICAVLVVFAVCFIGSLLPVTVTVNGTEVHVGGSKNIAQAVESAGIETKPGDLLAIDGSLLTKAAGNAFSATVNGQEADTETTKLQNGDVVEVADGTDTTEPAETVEEPIPYGVDVEGTGAIHIVEGEGVDGLKNVTSGTISGIVVEETILEPVNLVCKKLSPETYGDKVIALTFDDGPWDTYTEEILDILAQYNVKATFFTVGTCVESRPSLVRREMNEGHQVCTHSYDHAEGSGTGTNLGFMTDEEQVAEIEKGYAAIQEATGKAASTVVRVPGGNFGESVMRNLAPLITAEIGWNIDTEDWSRPGTSAVVAQIESAWPGCIVLMHDGGGDRSQTVEALKEALPYLISQGYSFVTINELMNYDLS